MSYVTDINHHFPHGEAQSVKMSLMFPRDLLSRFLPPIGQCCSLSNIGSYVIPTYYSVTLRCFEFIYMGIINLKLKHTTSVLCMFLGALIQG